MFCIFPEVCINALGQSHVSPICSLPEGEVIVFSFQFLNPSTYALYRIVVLVGDLTIVLFWSRFCIYSCVVGDRLSWDRSAVPLSSSWEKVVNVSLSTRKRRGSTVNGVPSAWLRWFALRSAINWSIKMVSSMVLNCKFLSTSCRSVVRMYWLEYRSFLSLFVRK